MKQNNQAIEKHRIINGRFASDASYGNNGCFRVRGPQGFLFVITSDGEGWEHVSVSHDVKDRCPTWEEMCFIKDLFWGEEETVVQYHPPRSEYVNCQKYTLHLWKPINVTIPLPPSWLVGTKPGDPPEKVLEVMRNWSR